MKHVKHLTAPRALALGLTLVLAAELAAPALAAGTPRLSPSHGETYYATLDYYGGVLDSSVVKSYQTLGNDTITDYGVYDEVVDLTSGQAPAVADGTVTFRLGENAPAQFYFQGKTTKPIEEFPWKLSLSYKLNGTPALAEDLAGQKGVVEITLDAVPNPAASEYSRNNVILTAVSAFNGDDVTSLEAEGAQLQQVGNLYCVLYMVMPGEEQHFTIRVGSEDFTYGGMVFLAVPATLDQLNQIADLREAKEKTEDSSNAIQDSMDAILDALDGMSGDIGATADGLERLNKARGTVSGGKGQVYDSLDIALVAAGPLTESMAPMAGHLAAAQQALTETTALLNEMSANLTGLKPEVENTRKLLKNLQSDLDALQELMDDLDNYPDEARRIAKSLSDDFSQLGSSLNSLEKSLKSMRGELSGMDSSLSGVNGGSEVEIELNGTNLTVSEVKGLVQQAKGAYSQYESLLGAEGGLPEGTSFHDFLTLIAGKSEAEAAQIETLLAYSQTDEYQEKIESAEKLNDLLDQWDMSVSQLKALVEAADSTAGPVLKQLENVCSALGSSALSGDLEDLSDMMEDMMEDIDDNSGALSSTAATLKSACELAIRVSANADTALDQVQSLTDIMNTYEPETQQALEDAKTFTGSASTSISALVDAARSAEGLMKDSGVDLDKGTQQTLSNLASALRKSTRALDQTDTIRDALDTVDALITDEWDSHTGEENNLLLIDPSAKPVSLTDPRNEGTTSIQYVLRTQEIKAEKAEEEAVQVQAADNGTFWSRVAQMFRDLWNFLTGWIK